MAKYSTFSSVLWHQKTWNNALYYDSSSQALVTWLEKRGGAAATVITKVSEAEKMIEDQEVVVIGFFADMDCEEAKAFKEAADKVDEAFFLLTSEADLRKAYSVDSDKALVLFKDFDEGRVVYDGDMTKSEARKG